MTNMMGDNMGKIKQPPWFKAELTIGLSRRGAVVTARGWVPTLAIVIAAAFILSSIIG
jgi:hypothetical protein